MSSYNFMSDSPSMFIDGIEITHMALCLEERPLIPTPKRKQIVTDSQFSQRGSIRENTGWEDIVINVSFNYLEDIEVTSQSFRMAFSTIRAKILKANRIQFNDEMNVYYNVKSVEIGNAVNTIIDYGSFTVAFTCSPFGYMEDDSEDEYILDSSISQNWFTIINDGLYTSYPTIKVRWYSGDLPAINLYELDESGKAITESKNNWYFTVHQQFLNQDIIIDSEKALLYFQVRSTGAISPVTDEVSMLTFPKLLDGVSYRVILANVKRETKVGITFERNRVI